jgi:hypothetical protein
MQINMKNILPSAWNSLEFPSLGQDKNVWQSGPSIHLKAVSKPWHSLWDYPDKTCPVSK